MSNVNNIIVKNATLKVANYGVEEGSALDIGALKGGVSIEVPREYYDVSVDAWLGVVKSVKIAEGMTVKCVMAESTLANLAVAFDYPLSAVNSGTFNFGGDASTNYRTLYINGDAPNGGTRKITLWKCIQVGSGTHAYKKDEETLIEVEFKVLEDTTKTANQRFGKIEDTGGDTTPPTIELTTPVDGGTVAKGTKDPVIWTITESNPMDEDTIVYGETVMIINTTTPSSASLVEGTIVYNPATKTITFTPSESWNASDTFQAIVTTGLADSAGNHLASAKIEQFSVTA